MEIGWLSIIPALVGIPAMLLFAWSSDKKNERKKHIITSFLFAAVGYIYAGFSDSTFIMIASLTFAAIGLYGFAGIFFAFSTFLFHCRYGSCRYCHGKCFRPFRRIFWTNDLRTV